MPCHDSLCVPGRICFECHGAYAAATTGCMQACLCVCLKISLLAGLAPAQVRKAIFTVWTSHIDSTGMSKGGWLHESKTARLYHNSCPRSCQPSISQSQPSLLGSMCNPVFIHVLPHTLSRLWKTREFLKATTDHANGPAAYAKVTCTHRYLVWGQRCMAE